MGPSLDIVISYPVAKTENLEICENFNAAYNFFRHLTMRGNMIKLVIVYFGNINEGFIFAHL